MIIDYARTEGIATSRAKCCATIHMLAMCRNLGFEVCGDPQEADLAVVRLGL